MTNMKYLEFKNLLGEAKRASDPVWCRFFYRPLSFPSGWLFYRIGIKANTVSLLTVLITTSSCLMMILSQSSYIIIAALLMNLVALMDCIDGNIARARNETGPGGDWMDALSGYTVYALLPLSLGIHLYLKDPYLILSGLWIVVGSVTSISNLFLRLIHQKFINSKLGESTQAGLKTSGSLFSKFSSEMGLVGWMMPTLLLAAITNMLEAYLVAYCLFYLTSALLTAIILARRAIRTLPL
jgi:phosphatidylglycerophosphate synthase